MPYTVEKSGDEYCVVRSGNSSQRKRTLSCHDTKAAAEAARREAESAGARAAASREWFRVVTNKAAVPEIHIYGDIGSTFFDESGVSASDFVDQLEGLDSKQIAIRINSLGGSAWDGLTIAQAIVRHPAQVTTYIDGVAASAASIVAVAGDKVVTSKYGQAMLHNASAMVMGNSKDLREVASQLDNLNASLAAFYADRAGGDVATWTRAMARETWYNADEMFAAGLATEIDTSAVREEVEKAVASAMDGTAERFVYQGRDAAPTPPEISNPPKEGRMADKKSIAESLGLDPEAASNDDILAAARKALGLEDDAPKDDPANPPVTEVKPIVDAPAEPVKEGAPAAPPAGEGTVELDAAAYAALRQQAAMGAEAHKTLQAQAHAKVVDEAIDAGKIPLPRRGHYLNLMSIDPVDTAERLAKLQPGAVVPLQELGHSAADDPAASASVKENPLYQAWKVS
jgi:ATP-dependent protease ClpP protease subunit